MTTGGAHSVVPADQAQRSGQLTGRSPGLLLAIAVRLVDGDHVGDLEDALLDALELVAGAGEGEEEEGVDHAGDRHLGLTDPDRLDQDHVVRRRPRGPPSPGVVARATPPRVPADGDGRMNAFGSVDSRAIRVLSPSTEPPVRTLDGSTASTPTRWPVGGQPAAERLDEGRLPDAGHAGDADPYAPVGRSTPRARQRGHQVAGLAAVLRAGRLDQRDGPRDLGATALADPLEEPVEVH